MTQRHSSRQRILHRFAGVPRVWGTMGAGSICRTVFLSSSLSHEVKTIVPHTVGDTAGRRQAPTAAGPQVVTFSVN